MNTEYFEEKKKSFKSNKMEMPVVILIQFELN